MRALLLLICVGTALLFASGCDAFLSNSCLFNDASNSYFPPDELSTITVARGDSAAIYAPDVWRAPDGECDKGENALAWVTNDSKEFEVRTRGGYMVFKPKDDVPVGSQTKVRFAARGIGFIPGSDPGFVYSPLTLTVRVGNRTDERARYPDIVEAQAGMNRVSLDSMTSSADTVTLRAYGLSTSSAASQRLNWFVFNEPAQIVRASCQPRSSEIGCDASDRIRVHTAGQWSIRGFVSTAVSEGSRESPTRGFVFEVSIDSLAASNLYWQD